MRTRGRDVGVRTVWACVCGKPFPSAVLRGHHTRGCPIKRLVYAWEADLARAALARARAVLLAEAIDPSLTAARLARVRHRGERTTITDTKEPPPCA